MNPELLAAIAANNSADLEAIIAKLGIANLLAVLPHILNILNTVQAEQKKGVTQ